MQSPQHAADLPAYVAVLILFKQRRDDNTQEVAQPLLTRSCPTEQFAENCLSSSTIENLLAFSDQGGRHAFQPEFDRPKRWTGPTRSLLVLPHGLHEAPAW